MAQLTPLLLLLIGACALVSARSDPQRPLFEFALIADIQYADKPSAGGREYRRALESLDACVADLTGRELAFVAQLGDVIDGRGDLQGSQEDLERVLERLEGLNLPLMHVVGNHCLSVPRDQLQERLGLPRSWYDFGRDGWRFVVLDSMDLSLQGVPEEHPRAVEAAAWLESHPPETFAHAFDWNGGFGSQQLAWLEERLARAQAAGERVVVFSHHPVLLEAARPAYLAWDHEALCEVLEASPAVVAFFNGHDHAGGYHQRGGVHYWTLPAMLAAPEGENAYAVIEAWPERLVVHGVGTVEDRVLAVD